MAPTRASALSPLITADRLAQLNHRSDTAGWRQVIGHLAVIVVSGAIWLQPALPLPLRLVALLTLGAALAFGFCAMHECGHRTAFASREISDAVAWWAGVLSFYNADFYRRYHQWHHRYTHQPGLDPELEDPPPSTLAAYLLANLARDRQLGLAAETVHQLQQYEWPGNVRELRNVLERAAAVCTGPVILPTHLPPEVARANSAPAAAAG